MEYDICMLANDELSDIVCVSYLLRNHVGMSVNKTQKCVCVCVCFYLSVSNSPVEKLTTLVAITIATEYMSGANVEMLQLFSCEWDNFISRLFSSFCTLVMEKTNKGGRFLYIMLESWGGACAYFDWSTNIICH